MPGSETLLEIPVRAQEMTQWCWAAVTSGLSAVFSTTPLAPCRIASRLTNGHPCCSDPAPCNQEHGLVEALGVVNVRAAHRDLRNGGSFAHEEVVTRLRQGLPIGARIQHRTTGLGHFVLIVGCDPANRTVISADPNGPLGFPAPRYRMPYDSFLTAYGDWGFCTDLYLVGA